MFGVAAIQEGTMLEDTGFHSPILMPGWAFPEKCRAFCCSGSFGEKIYVSGDN